MFAQNLSAIILLVAVVGVTYYTIKYNISKKSFVASFEKSLKYKKVPIITFNFMIEGKSKAFNFVVDTGSMLNIIASDTLELLDKKDSCGLAARALGTNGTEESLGKYYLEFYYENYLFIDMFVSSKAFVKTREQSERAFGIRIDGLLGSSFLDKSRANINFKNKTIQWRKF